jgi:O-antigen/teichoic acid export membrane protein
MALADAGAGTVALGESEPRPSGATPGAPPFSILRRIRGDALLLGAGTVAVLLAQLAFRSILIATLPPSGYGRLALLFSVYNTVWILGASGLPNALARYLAINPPACDSAIIRSALLAAAAPVLIAAFAVAAVAVAVLHSGATFALAPAGLAALILSLLAMGVLRGRGRMRGAAAIMPVAALAELLALALVWRLVGVSESTAFAAFCLGNIIALVVGAVFVHRTRPRARQADAREGAVPGPGEVLRFSAWIGAATVGIALLPLVVRAAASIDSYTLVAVIDIALLLFALPQRIGTVIVLAVVPHASRALAKEQTRIALSLREHLLVAAPFTLAAAAVAFTPLLAVIFDALGRPVYDRSAGYLALALLAGPARVLYGVVEGVLVARGEGRFLALAALGVAALASALILALALASQMLAAFAVFAAACWLSYLVGLRRMRRPAADLPAASA